MVENIIIIGLFICIVWMLVICLFYLKHIYKFLSYWTPILNNIDDSVDDLKDELLKIKTIVKDGYLCD